MPTLVATGQITIADVNDGAAGPALVLVASAQGFTFWGSQAEPATQSISFTVVRQRVSGDVIFTASNGAVLDTDAGRYGILGVTTGLLGAANGDTCYLDVTQFGAANQISITATVGDLSAVCNVSMIKIGTTIGDDLTGQITLANVADFIASGAIGSAQVGTLVAGNIDTTGLSIKDLDGNVIFEAGSGVSFSERLLSTTGLPAENATVGAPAGTLVGTTLSTVVEENASSGQVAYDAINHPDTGLDHRMKANADNILGGVLSTQTVGIPAGLRVGGVLWDEFGDVIPGTAGVAITPKGIFGCSATKTTFTIDATTGNAAFSGDITGATGTFSGSLTAETLGSTAQTPITITASGNVTVPAGMTAVRYELIGGGGGGGGGATAYAVGYGGGGGAGGYMSGTMAVTAGAVLAVVIGSGGAGGANTLAGVAGTASTFAGVVSAAGGAGAAALAAGFGAGGTAGASVPSGTSTAGATAVRVYDGVNNKLNGAGLLNGESKLNGLGFPRFGITGAGGSTPKGTGGTRINTGAGNAGAGYGSGGGGGGGSLTTSVSAVGGAGAPGVAVLAFFNANGVVLQNQFNALTAALTRQGIAIV